VKSDARMQVSANVQCLPTALDQSLVLTDLPNTFPSAAGRHLRKAFNADVERDEFLTREPFIALAQPHLFERLGERLGCTELAGQQIELELHGGGYGHRVQSDQRSGSLPIPRLRRAAWQSAGRGGQFVLGFGFVPQPADAADTALSR
jgi:hypothetical protein